MRPDRTARQTWGTQLANGLSLSRVALAAMLWVCPRETRWTLGLVALAAISDMLDGRVARWARRGAARETEPRGAWLDPLCDKIFVLSLMVMLLVTRRAAPWTFVLLTTREWLLAGAVALWWLLPPARRSAPLRYSANLLGKATTVVQFMALLALLVPAMQAFRGALAAGAAALGALAVRGYVRRQA